MEVAPRVPAPDHRRLVRSWGRRALYWSGGFEIWRRRRTSHSLTVLLFHRIQSASAAEGDPAFTIGESQFIECLTFLRARYAIVGADELIDHIDTGRPLPRRALLLTFDDGWADTADVALPILAAFGLPAILFVATDAVGDDGPVWWQEVVADAWRRGSLAPDTPGERPQGTAQPHLPALLTELARMPANRRAKLLRPMSARMPGLRRQMLSPQQLKAMQAHGFAMASHGAAHLPFTALTDQEIDDDLARSRAALAGWIGLPRSGPGRLLAFPHGRYDGRVVVAAARAGFNILFCSDPHLNLLPAAARPVLLGRIPIGRAAMNGNARFAADRFMAWLVARPIRPAAFSASCEGAIA